MDINNRKNSTYIFASVGIIFFVILLYQFFGDNPSPYMLSVVETRKQKDYQFKNAGDSPLKEADKAKFEGLSYFPASENYRIKAVYTPAAGRDTLVLQTTKAEKRKMLKAGSLDFELFDHKYQLSAFTHIGQAQDELFIPFKDLTSGVSTYGGGRYVEVSITNLNDIWLDFNKAYNPLCLYNESYSCPIPPSENKLAVEIFAGEKMYGEKH